MGYQAYLSHDSWGNFLIFSENHAMQHICRHHNDKTKITIKYIK